MLRPYGDAYGFDLTMSGVEFAHAHGHRVARASIASIPFSNATFDLVTSFDVFQVLPDEVERAAIVEMARVLKPGGRLVLNVAALKILHGRHSVLSEEKSAATHRSACSGSSNPAGFRIDRLSFAHAAILPILLPVRVWHRFVANGSVAAGESEISVPSRAGECGDVGLGGSRSASASAGEHADRQLADVSGAEATCKCEHEP